MALDKDTGKVIWKSKAALGHYSTPVMGETIDGKYAVMVSRVRISSQGSRKPYGFSLVDIENGETLWDAELPARNFLYNTSWNKEYALWIHMKKFMF